MIRPFILFMSLFFAEGLLAKPIEIVFWHSMAGHLGDEVQVLVKGFNQRQSTFVIKAIYKGDYNETLTSFAAAFRAKQAPALIQIFEVGSTIMVRPKGIIKPVAELMQEQGLKLPDANFFPALKANYSDKGQSVAMPLNTSIPVMYYNAEALASVGYSKATFPRTWNALEILVAKFRQSGFSCGYTSAYPSWIFIESFSAIHGLPMMDPVTQQAIYNSQAQIDFLSRLVRWQQLHYFEYGGRSDDATTLFTSGRCPLLSQSSGAYEGLAKTVTFHVGMVELPFDDTIRATRHNNVIGGAALWVITGKTSAVYRGVAQFIAYLAEPKVQEQWYKKTGYLPLGITGPYKILMKQGISPSLDIAKRELQGASMPAQVIRTGAANQIRAINDESLEMIFSGLKYPKEAMAEAVSRANHAQHRFIRNTSLF